MTISAVVRYLRMMMAGTDVIVNEDVMTMKPWTKVPSEIVEVSIVMMFDIQESVHRRQPLHTAQTSQTDLNWKSVLDPQCQMHHT
jgi:hypothetical protein